MNLCEKTPIKLYICNRKSIIADGVCDGSGCMDCEPYCSHTSDPKYAKYDPVKDITKWEKVPMYDETTGYEVMTEWEIDPEEAKEVYS